MINRTRTNRKNNIKKSDVANRIKNETEGEDSSSEDGLAVKQIDGLLDSADGSRLTETNFFRLNQSEEPFTTITILDSLKDFLLIAHPDGVIAFGNATWSKALGIPPSQLVGRHISQIISPGFFSDHQLGELFLGQKIPDLFIPFVSANQSIVLMHIRFSVIDQAGQKIILALGRDVETQLSLEPQALEENRNKGLFFERSADIFCVVSSQGIIEYHNQAWSKALSLSEGKIKNRPFSDLIYEQDRPFSEAKIQQAFQTNSQINFENRIVGADGNLCWLSWSFYVSYNRHMAYGVARDITENKLWHLKVANREKRFRAIFENTNDAILWIESSQLSIVHCNKAAERLIGLSREEILTQSLDFIHSDRDPGYFENFIKSVVERQEDAANGNYTTELKIFAKDGNSALVHIAASQTVIDDQKIVQVIFHDITELSLALQTIQLQNDELIYIKERYELLFNTMYEGLLIVKGNQILDANKTFAEMFGYQYTQLFRLTLSDFPCLIGMSNPDQPQKRQVQQVLAQRRNGSRFHCEITCKNMSYKDQVFDFYACRDISKEIESSQKLRQSQASLKALIENTDDIIISFDPKMHIIAFNQAARNLYKELYNIDISIGLCLMGFLTQSQQAWWQRIHERVLNGQTLSKEVTVQKEGYGKFIYEMFFNPIRDEGVITGFSTFSRDITLRKEAELEIQRNWQLYRTLVKNLPDTIVVLFDPDLRVHLLEGKGFPYPEVDKIALEGKDAYDIVNLLRMEKSNAEYFIKTFKQTIRGRRSKFEGKINERFFEISMIPVLDKNQEVFAGIMSARDITENKALQEGLAKSRQERLETITFYDILTKLPNKNLFEKLVNKRIYSSMDSKKIFAVLIMDIRQFVYINQTYGNHVGDELLKMIAARLNNIVGNNDAVARIGGDKFGVMFGNVEQFADIVVAAKALSQELHKPYVLDDHKVYLHTCAGIAVYPSDGISKRQLISRAEIAQISCRSDRDSQFRFYTQELNSEATTMITLSEKLRHALEHDEFHIFFQPYFHGLSGKLAGMEALLRWNYPDKSLVNPAKFIPVLEETGLIRNVGINVIIMVCKCLKRWLSLGLEIVPVSINLSPVQFKEKSLVDDIIRIIGGYDLDFRYFTFEITESTFMADVAFTNATLRRLKDAGFSISIDDFGTGYSSLSYLKKFPLDNLKIDISFVREITAQPDDKAIVQAVISLAKILNLKTIAEGVETKEQLDILNQLGVDYIQGYYFSKPIKDSDLEKIFMSQAKTSDS